MWGSAVLSGSVSGSGEDVELFGSGAMTDILSTIVKGLRSFLSITLRIFTVHNYTRHKCAHIKKWWLQGAGRRETLGTRLLFLPELSREINRHFLLNEYGDLSVLCLFLN